MAGKIEKSIAELIKTYSLLVQGIERKATDAENRAYGGVIRAGKGILVEGIAKRLVDIAWRDLNRKPEKLSLARASVKIPLKKDYLAKIKNPDVSDYIKKNISKYYYSLKTDIHVSINGKFALAIECKAYAENAMLKRILVDFTLLKQVYPDLSFVLFQLESQLGGDYSKTGKIHYGSAPTHTLLSYFDIDLHIITLLEGERKVDRPIHKNDYYKELKAESLLAAVGAFKEILRDF